MPAKFYAASMRFAVCLSLTRLPVGAFIGNAMQNTENARRFVHLARTRRILSACVAEQERSEILSRLEACLNSQAGSPDLRQRGDYLRHLSYLRVPPPLRRSSEPFASRRDIVSKLRPTARGGHGSKSLNSWRSGTEPRPFTRGEGCASQIKCRGTY